MPIQRAKASGTLAATRRAGCEEPSKTCSLPMSQSVRKPSPEVLQEVCPMGQRGLSAGAVCSTAGCLEAGCLHNEQPQGQAEQVEDAPLGKLLRPSVLAATLSA